MVVKVGEKAPDFTLPADGGGAVALKALGGKRGVVRGIWRNTKVPDNVADVLDAVKAP